MWATKSRLALLFTFFGVFSIFANSTAIAQTGTGETAKPADTVSPYGVSYISGSFTYSVPLFSIGYGEWPNRIDVSLNYDSSGARRPNDPWTLSIQHRVYGFFESYPTDWNGNPIYDEVQVGLNLVLGNRSKSFFLGDFGINQPQIDQSQFVSASLDGSEIRLAEGSSGLLDHLKIIDRDGSEISFQIGGYSYPVGVDSPITWRTPDGNKIEYSQPLHWNGSTTLSNTSTGLFIRMFGDQICAFNAATIDPTTVTSCAQSPLVATIRTTRFQSSSPAPPRAPIAFRDLVTSVTRPDGSTYNFEYDQYYSLSYHGSGSYSQSVVRFHLACVKEPGQSVCAVRNKYSACDGSGIEFFNPPFFGEGYYVPVDSGWSGSRDKVLNQTLADGRIINYQIGSNSVGPGPDASTRGCNYVFDIKMSEGGATTQVDTAFADNWRSPGVGRVIDPLGRETRYTWSGGNPAAASMSQPYRLDTVTLPDGRVESYAYDSRGNLERTVTTPRPGSGDPIIEVRASFPAACTNPKTCNQPTSVTDANGNVTSYSYDPAHGGVLTMTGPSVGGVSPTTRYYYMQKEAWLRSGAGYAKTGEPIWLKSEERSCRTSTLDLVAGTCSAGAGDLVRTLYDYGPDSGPNNLWLRGMAVVADGQTLRTCYQYDQLGRRIAETQPLGTGATCP